MRLLGTLVRLQIQTASLKVGEKPNQRYDPAPLLAVEELRITREGASALDAAGEVELDIHHLDHPETKQAPGENPLSIGFTSHYDRMQSRFGPRVEKGIAGENLIVECADEIALESLKDGVAIRSRVSGRLLTFRNLKVAHPCRPFSLFVLGGEAEPEALKATLRFLDGGMRGFYLVADAGEAFVARPGDEVFAL